MRHHDLGAGFVDNTDGQGLPQNSKEAEGERRGLFTFLVKDINPDNNVAERGIRPAVVMRNNSHGNRSDKGAETTSVLLSVVQTCDLKEQNFLNWTAEYFQK